jgi:hypothetical protein
VTVMPQSLPLSLLSSLPKTSKCLKTMSIGVGFCIKENHLADGLSGCNCYVNTTARHLWNVRKVVCGMGKAKKTRKFAEVKRLLSPKDRECVFCTSA